ncbi:MAG: 4Fe-4S ferredoxin [Candidatus Zixiibacteriota bacterium]
MAKVLREIIRINEELCDGCGDCISSCAEGALVIVNGKAKLKGEILCDGAGACIGHCSTGALTIEKRESEAYDEAAVALNLARTQQPSRIPVGAAHGGQLPMAAHAGGCPGSAMRQWNDFPPASPSDVRDSAPAALTQQPSRLRQWPVQLMLVQLDAPFFRNADLIITADCVPFAFPDFHQRFLSGKALVVGCPKLDDLRHYFDKLTQIFKVSELKSVEVIKMDVPCCGGIAQAAVEARKRSHGTFPLTITTIGIRGELQESYRV